MALGLFRFIAALGRTQVVAHTLGTFSLFVVFILGGFIVAKSKFCQLESLLNSQLSSLYMKVQKMCLIIHFSLLMADDLEPWLKWTYYFSPLSYGQNAIVMNEFLDKRWSSVSFHIISRNYHKVEPAECSSLSWCSLIQTLVSMELLLEKSSFIRGDSSQRSVGFGFVVLHS